MVVTRLLCDQASAYRQATDVTRDIHRDLAAEMASYHARNNAFYRQLCTDAGIAESSVLDRLGDTDIDAFPLLPVSLFKGDSSHRLLSCNLDDIELEIRSTGTSGIPSVARRDGPTVTRCAHALIGSYREFFRLSAGHVAFLCPSTAEYPEMGMLKVFNVLNGMVNSSNYAVTDDVFAVDKAISALGSVTGTTRHLVGPPFAISRLVHRLAEQHAVLPLDRNSMVIMLGGWKRYTGEQVSRPVLEQLIHERLSLPATQVRDMYGLIESSMLAIECEYHNKHVPPWCRISVRAEDDVTRPLPERTEGVIAVHDYVNSSYPGFILTDDLGTVEWADCDCGRRGQLVSFSRRRTGAEIGCCAISLEQWIDEASITRDCAGAQQ